MLNEFVESSKNALKNRDDLARRARMMTEKKKENGNNMGDWMRSQLVCVTSPTPRDN